MTNYKMTNEELKNKMHEIKKTVEENGKTTFTIYHWTRRCQIVLECEKYGLKATRPTKASAYVIISKR